MTTCFTNSLAWLFILAAGVNILLGLYLERYGSRTTAMTWLKTLIYAGACYFLSYGLGVCSTTQSSFDFWITVNDGLSAILDIMPFIFSLYFTKKEHLLRKLWIRTCVIAAPLIYLWLSWKFGATQVPILSQSVLTWGYHAPALGGAAQIAGALVLLEFAAPLIILLKYYFSLSDPLKRRQTRLVLGSMIIGLWTPVIFQALLPVYLGVPAWPAGPISMMIMTGMLIYASQKYGAEVFEAADYTNEILRLMPSGLVVLDPNDRIQYANHGAATLLGYVGHDLRGRYANVLFGGPSRFKTFSREVLGQLADGEQVNAYETRLVTNTKHTLMVSLNAANIYTGPRLIGRMLSFTDITGLKETERQLEAERDSVEKKVADRTRELSEIQAQLSASVQSLPFGFAIVSRDMQIMFANELLGYYAAGSPKTGGRNLSTPTFAELVQRYADSIDLLELVDKVMKRRRADERTALCGASYYRFVVTPVLEAFEGRSQIIGVVLLIEDVTEAKNLQRSRDEFFSIASHELRTPLTAIRGNTEMMLDYYRDELSNPELREMVGDVHGASVRLIQIVNDFLDTSRLEVGKIVFNIAPLDLVPFLRDIVRQYQVTGSRQKVAIEVQDYAKPSLWVRADADRLRQVVINLLGNALRATHGGSITLSLDVEGEMCKLAVTDTGKGIPADEQHLLFRKFQQASQDILTRDATHGTGLGLYISRKLMEGMHGKLYLVSTKVNVGTQFALEVPIANQPVEPAPADGETAK